MRERFGRWVVRGTLGSGGMGHVWRAVDPATGRYAAVKVARVRPAARAALTREIAALERLRHPGLVRFLEHGVEDDELWVATELVAGQALRDRVAETHPSSSASVDTLVVEDPTTADRSYFLPERMVWTKERLVRALDVFRRLCEPLAWLHGEGFVHGDVKPENVLLRPDGSVVLVDLGLLRGFDTGVRDTLAVDHRVMGTTGYLSPEQCLGLAADGRSDLYAVGCMLFELLTGRPPYGHGKGAAWRHVNTPAPAVSDSCDVPPELERLVGRMLEKDPRRRLGYAGDLGEWLDAWGVTARPVGPPCRRVLFRPSLVGRDDALAALKAHRAVVLCGEPGLGKTRVASQLRDQRDVPSVAGLGSDARGLVGSLVSSLASRARPEEAPAWFGHAVTVFAGLEPAVLELLGLSAVEAEALPDTTVLAAVERALVAAAPLRLVLDDLHLVDPLGEALCERLARRPLPGVSVSFSGVAPALESRLVSAGAHRVTLGPLPGEAVDRMVREALADASPPDELLAFLRAHAGGNPRFVWEYANQLVTEGFLVRRHERWLVRDRDRLEALPAPEGIRGLALRRVSGLSAELRDAAGRATVLGLDALSEAHRDALLAARVVERTDGGWAWIAPAFERAAQSTLPEARLRALHAEALVRLPATAPAARRAGHLAAAGEVALARAAYAAAIADASRRMAWRELVSLCETSRRLPGTPPDEDARLRVELAKAHRARGHFTEAVAVLDGLEDDLSTPEGRAVRFHRARALARTPETARAVALLQDAYARDASDPARWLEALAETWSEAGDLPASIAARRQAVDALARGGDPARLARSRVALANVLQRQDRVVEATALVSMALPVLEAEGDPLWLGHAYACHAVCHASVDEAVVRSSATRAIETYRSIGYVPNEAQVVGVLVESHRRAGESEVALRWLERMEALADEIGSERLQGQAAYNRGAVLFAVRDPTALDVLQKLLPELRRVGYTQGEGMAAAYLAVLLREADRWTEALQVLERLDAIAAQRDDLGLAFYAAVERTHHARHAGRDGRAEFGAVLDVARRAERLDAEDRALLAQLAVMVESPSGPSA